MIVELGHFALILALMVALVQATLPMWGAHTGDRRLMALVAHKRGRPKVVEIPVPGAGNGASVDIMSQMSGEPAQR